MSDSDTEYKNWICNNPTEYEIRFNSDSDILSSDDSDDEQYNNSVKLKKYNQLLPRGKLIQKLLRTSRPRLNDTWRPVHGKLDFLNRYSEDDRALDDHSNSVADQGQFSITNEKSLSQSNFKDNNIQKTIESRVDLEEYDTESELESVTYSEVSFEKMATKSHKRKREASEEEDTSVLKKLKSNEVEKTSKKVKRKENSHNVSSSESEDSKGNSLTVVSKKIENVVKPNRNSLNTHLLSSESDLEALSQGPNTSFIGSDNDEREPIENSRDEISQVKNTVTVSSVATNGRNKLYNIPKFTQELNQEISQFSVLLDENLVEKNDIWILQCPSNMDCSALLNQRLNLSGSCQLSDGDRTYESYSYRNSRAKAATLAVPSERNRLDLRRIQITGNIIVEESVESANDARQSELLSEPPSRVEFPDNLKVRHPLLGIDFSKQARTAEVVAVGSSKTKKRSKKHEESFNGSILDTESVATPSKKKKKNKEIFNNISISDHALLEESVDDSCRKKKKKKKHKDSDSYLN